jgi:hypothetical protein
MLRISATGFDRSVLNITLDGRALDFKSQGTLDRTFYEWTGDTGLSRGNHELVFTSMLPPLPGKPIQQLANLDLEEYANEDLYHTENSYIGAYPTFNSGGRKTYRPTNEGCLMRNMGINSFCPGILVLI